MKTYNELMSLQTFEDRYEYLRSTQKVGEDTFGSSRYLNQKFYKSAEWKQVRDKVIVRDNGCDLGIVDRPINGRILIHHIEPITEEDIVNFSDKLLDPDNLICVSNETHQAIHYGSMDLLPPSEIQERSPGDTILW